MILSYLLLALPCIKQSLNVKYFFPSFLNPDVGARVVSGGLIILSDNPLDFHSERRPVLEFKIIIYWLKC